MRAVLAVVIGLTMTAWVALDADRRGRNWFAWATIVALTGIIGLVSWLGSRRQSEPVAMPAGMRHRVKVALTSVPLVAVSVMVTGFIVTFLGQSARVEGRAMAPTLEDQDRLIVNKLVYQFNEPRVLDIVMLHYPLNPERVFVKRVIGEEGDRIRIVNGRVYRNEVLVADSYVPDEYRSKDNWGPEVIPEGYYFVLGDRRNNSSDSRHWGFVPKKYIVGRVSCRWWPIATSTCF